MNQCRISVDYGDLQAIIEHVYESTTRRQDLLEELAQLAERRQDIDFQEADVLAELHQLDKANFSKARPADLVDSICQRTRISRSEARRKAARVGLLIAVPEARGAFDSGHIAAGHIDVLASGVPAKYVASIREDSDNLLARAADLTADEFARALRDWVSDLRRSKGEDPEACRRADNRFSMKPDRGTGMTRISGLLDPEIASVARNALAAHERELLRADQQSAREDSSFEKRTYPQRLADALGLVCRSSLGAECGAGKVADPTVVVSIGLSQLVSGEGEALAEGGGPISVETARKMACEGGVIPAVLDGDGIVLDMGRKTRLATAGQRLALQIEFGGCAVPGCDAPFEWCHMHHIDFWENGGVTDLDNLLPLCTRHHALAHVGRVDCERIRSRDPGEPRSRSGSGDRASPTEAPGAPGARRGQRRRPRRSFEPIPGP